MPREEREPALRREEAVVVLGALELAAEVEAPDDVPAVDARRRERVSRGRGRGGLRGGELREPAAERVEDCLPDGEGAVVGVLSLDDDPGRLGRARAPERPLGDLAEGVVEAEVLPVELRDPPPRLLLLGESLEALLLLLLRQVEPELEDERPLGGEHALEADDLVAGVVELGVVRLSVGPPDDRLRVPRAEEDPHLPLGRELPPEAPHVRALELLARRLPERPRLDVPGVHPLVEEVDRLALAGAVHATDDDDDRELLRRRHVELSGEESLAERWLALGVSRVVDGVTDLGRLEHDLPRGFLDDDDAIEGPMLTGEKSARDPVFASCRVLRSR